MSTLFRFTGQQACCTCASLCFMWASLPVLKAMVIMDDDNDDDFLGEAVYAVTNCVDPFFCPLVLYNSHGQFGNG